MSEIYTTCYNSPIGAIEISGTEDGLNTLYFRSDSCPGGNAIPGCLLNCINQLDEYFKGKRQIFDLSLNPAGTDFQKRVWKELINIPFGETISYLELARRLGDAKAMRAVGGANGKNKISVIIPCHRVIGTNGKLTGYGGELWRKQWLLNHENSLAEFNIFDEVRIEYPLS
ncbi:MAG: methylated-DNA--[protein]-cysteine S-methyltransferase [Ignavibacteria bacterium]